ncbi:ThiF family adenylyltransferase [Microbispora amethystogenes]|uniref:Thiamine biosynthesis protein ThiF n=1 Tax=Microbispora cellulosiformans TaxID=2614688 RepID=A0A5J5K3B7_9ACTN|nr:ThiF family adenylyltransferase [Microbispora cellulosiformans]KAA9377729.1 thiamine biosynthesis protein ThiF [Microbispora cellulosiformans]
MRFRVEPFTGNPRFQRNLGILDEESMKRVADTHVLVAGVGGAGGQCAADLARLGFGWVTLADFDVYEIHNANRQIGSFDSTLGRLKIDVVGDMCQDINPELRIRKVAEGVTEDNVDSLLSGFDGKPVDYVVEAIDIVGARAKERLHQACRKRDVVIMTALMLGFGAALHVFQPDAPLYEDLYVLPDGRIDLPKIIPGLGGYVVQEYWDACFAGRGHAPTCVVGATTAAGMTVSEIMRAVLLGRDQMVSYPEYLYVDFFEHRYVRGSVASA